MPPFGMLCSVQSDQHQASMPSRSVGSTCTFEVEDQCRCLCWQGCVQGCVILCSSARNQPLHCNCLARRSCREGHLVADSVRLLSALLPPPAAGAAASPAAMRCPSAESLNGPIASTSGRCHASNSAWQCRARAHKRASTRRLALRVVNLDANR